MAELLNESPLYMPERRYQPQAIQDKGEQIMEGLLLSQYANSPNLKEYYMAFMSELDFLFEQIEEVYFGRFLDFAVGVQLDTLGIILQQSRAVILPKTWFGFFGAPNIAGMADEATPALGGLFKDEYTGNGDITELDDITYRKMLMAKAAVLNRDSADLSLAYFVVSILLGRVPSVFVFRDKDSGVPSITGRRVDLLLEADTITSQERALILYMKKYFVPVGVTFTITEE